jgi:hypothetical protein
MILAGIVNEKENMSSELRAWKCGNKA